MLFKKKIPVDDYCRGSLTALFSPERESVYEKLRDECADPALDAADQQLYFDHIRAIVIQLMLIAITKTYGLSAITFRISSDAGVFVMTYLKERALSRIESLGNTYSNAFGGHFQDGVLGIVTVFSQQLTQGHMRAETQKRFYVEFYAILKSLFDDFKSIRLTAR